MVVDYCGAEEGQAGVVEQGVRVGRGVDEGAGEGLEGDFGGERQAGVEGGEFC